MSRNLMQLRKYQHLFRIRRKFSSRVEPSENEPVKFTSSAAAQKNVTTFVRRPSKDDAPWYQTYSVLGSVTIFMLYFCVFREESDIDLEFNKTLFSRIKGLEKEQLLQAYKYNKENGLSVADIEERLKEIEQEEANAIQSTET